MRAYKAFEIGLECRGYRFVNGKNVTDKANCRANGFHCAVNPVDCLHYYPDARISEYWVVDAGGDIDEDALDSKVSCTELVTIRKLSINEYLLHCLSWLAKYPKDRNDSKVHKNVGIANFGYAIVCGVYPVAKGEAGDYLALLQVNKAGHPISMGIYRVGDQGIEPGKYYDVMGQEKLYE